MSEPTRKASQMPPRLGGAERARLVAEITRLEAERQSGKPPKSETRPSHPAQKARTGQAGKRASGAATPDAPDTDWPDAPPRQTELAEPAPKDFHKPKADIAAKAAAMTAKDTDGAPAGLPMDEAASVALASDQKARPPKLIDQWSHLTEMSVDLRTLERNLVITASRRDPAHAQFDVLRTRMLQALRENGWRRVAVTSPTAGCGKSFTAVNLALTLSRYEGCRTVLMDMDLRNPGLARHLGQTPRFGTAEALRGDVAPEQWLARVKESGLNIGRHLAIGLNDQPEDFPAELLQSPTAAEVLSRIESDLAPDVVLYDLPPALDHDDVIAFRPHFDCVLMVVGGGITRADEVTEATRRIGDDRPIIGVVLNRAEGG